MTKWQSSIAFGLSVCVFIYAVVLAIKNGDRDYVVVLKPTITTYLACVHIYALVEINCTELSELEALRSRKITLTVALFASFTVMLLETIDGLELRHLIMAAIT